MRPGSIFPKTIKLYSSSYEIYKHISPKEWEKPIYKELKLEDPSDYRQSVYNVLESLLFSDCQYSEEYSKVSMEFSTEPSNNHNIFRHNEMRPVCSYTVISTCDMLFNGFFCYTSQSSKICRPLHSEYLMFLTEVFFGEGFFYKLPFLLALQRTCYLWLMEICKRFELKGSVGFDVRWAHSDPKKDYYDLFSARVHMDFDMTQSKTIGNGFMDMMFCIKLTPPDNLRRNKISKNSFAGDEVFYDSLWNIRLGEIEHKIQKNYPEMKCDEVLIEDEENSNKKS